MARTIRLLFALLASQSVLTQASDAKVTAASTKAHSQGTEVCSTCAKGSTLTCCQATFAGDTFSVQFLANLTKYPLTPKDVNCIGIRADQFSNPANCVGVKTCCDVVLTSDLNTGLGDILGVGLLKVPVLGLFCQGINQTCSAQYSESGTHC